MAWYAPPENGVGNSNQFGWEGTRDVGAPSLPEFYEMFAAAGDRAALWIAPGAFGRYPEEYEQRVVRFFEERLINAARD